MNYNDEFTIIVDTREQQPWEFEYYSKANRKLDTGDYSIEGLENIFTIERKKSVAEIANNISEKRFNNALSRLKEYKYKFLLLEFSLDNVLDYPVGSTVPKKTWEKLKITSKYILKYLTKIAIEHNIQIFFCGNKDAAEEMAISIMKRVFEKYNHE
jgi:ERCC4-type nuclease